MKTSTPHALLALAFLALASLPPRAAAAGAMLRVEILPRFDDAPLVFDSLTNTLATGQRVSVTRLEFLLSNIALRRTDGAWLAQPDEFAYLSGREGRTSFTLAELPAGAFDRVRFNIGVPPKENHADPAGLGPDHSLNPNVNGLHWSWQDGYVFLAMEGGWIKPDGRQSGYSYHIATDRLLMTIELPLTLDLSADRELRLALNVDDIFSGKHRLRIAEDATSTHSRADDPLADQLRENIQHAFAVENIRAAQPSPVGTRATNKVDIAATATPYRLTLSGFFPQPALPLDNPLTEEGVELGRRLFNDARLSVNKRQSCASCHHAESAFTEARRFSLGAEGQAGSRNAMPLLNLAWKNSFFWDGRAPSLREQVLQPIQNPIEMHETLTNVVAKLKGTRALASNDVTKNLRPELGPLSTLPQTLTRPAATLSRRTGAGSQDREKPLPPFEAFSVDGQNAGLALYPSEFSATARSNSLSPGERAGVRASLSPDYPPLFARAFGTPEITANRIARALEQFLLVQVSHDSKFDRSLAGPADLTAEEKHGFELFHTEYDPRRGQFGADCFHCHGGPLFQSQGFANNGLDSEFKDVGRYEVTKKEGDKGKFAVPSLRNVAVTAPYMHDGRFATLEEVLEHYSTGVKHSATLDPNLAKHPDGGVPLSSDDQRALIVFLKTLTDERFVTRKTELSKTP